VHASTFEGLLYKIARPDTCPNQPFKLTVKGEVQEVAYFKWNPNMPLCSDGSCKNVDDPELAIAASVACQYTQDGSTQIASMSVPAGHPCSAVYAEQMTLLMVEAFTPPHQQFEPVADC
jgi:hypothetical protein